MWRATASLTSVITDPWPLFWLVLGAVWLRFGLLAGAVVARRGVSRVLGR
jgi:hypothetical protein